MQLNTWLPVNAPNPPGLKKIIKAEGSYLYTADGLKLYDAIASWWCKPLGHRHPLVIKSMQEQLALFEHHIPADFYNETLETLSAKLCSYIPNMNKVLYASDGSSAVEIALKLSLEYRKLTGDTKRNKFMALSNSYHGETLASLSLCGIDFFKTTYAQLLTKEYFIQDVVYVSGVDDPLYTNCNYSFECLTDFFKQQHAQISGLIIEPLVQGAGGLKIISKDYLQKLCALATHYKIHIIADEIMVGLGRLGVYSVIHELVKAHCDFWLIAKNLTAGAIPMSAVVVNQEIVTAFSQTNTIFSHSHTHSGNALAARIGINYLNYLENSNLLASIQQNQAQFNQLFKELSLKYSFIKNPRGIGAISACELDLSNLEIKQLSKAALNNGLYLRPIANTLYILPPIYNLATDFIILKDLLTQSFAQLE